MKTTKLLREKVIGENRAKELLIDLTFGSMIYKKRLWYNIKN